MEIGVLYRNFAAHCFCMEMRESFLINIQVVEVQQAQIFAYVDVEN